MNFAVGKKMNMSQHFLPSGEVIPVTVLKVPNLVITQVKTVAGKDKYAALQVGFGSKNKLNRPQLGHAKKFGKFARLVEFRISNPQDYQVGGKVEISGFQVGELVNCVGTMKGRGFAGAIKRHGFAGFPASHGHDRPRSVGSIGQRFPQHTRKGLRMSGHMGNTGVTVKNLQVVEVDPKRGLLALKGAVPGHASGVVKIISTGKVRPLAKVVAEKEEKKKK